MKYVFQTGVFVLSGVGGGNRSADPSAEVKEGAKPPFFFLSRRKFNSFENAARKPSGYNKLRNEKSLSLFGMRTEMAMGRIN